MLGDQIEAVFEDGVFRPLAPVDLPEHQRVKLVTPAEEEADDREIGYQPLPLDQSKTIRVRLKRVGEIGPLPYPIDSDELEPE